ncbi:hypothetical protein NGR_b07580 (plasmid) [Sinorhizobium fredii NGR234]|uniref:Abasic site processing protein n=1 Tax=Sinorhizobium fredii (strain NBRC 101917 / NGR234) TaxID=394 RepID=C3KQ58_SINFN|nr:hypothetical protein NGR_b07580 [Sinorhizobium fredii NGR234]
MNRKGNAISRLRGTRPQLLPLHPPQKAGWSDESEGVKIGRRLLRQDPAKGSNLRAETHRLAPQYRCIVPWTAFCEYEDTKPKKTARWFSLDPSEPAAFFAGIWTPWNGERGSMKNPRAGEHEPFDFLTCDANEIVKPIHPKALPVTPDGACRNRALAHCGVEGSKATAETIPYRCYDAAASWTGRGGDPHLTFHRW